MTTDEVRALSQLSVETQYRKDSMTELKSDAVSVPAPNPTVRRQVNSINHAKVATRLTRKNVAGDIVLVRIAGVTDVYMVIGWAGDWTAEGRPEVVLRDQQGFCHNLAVPWKGRLNV